MIESFKNIYRFGACHVSPKLGNQTVMAQRSRQIIYQREPVTDDCGKHLQGVDSLGIIPINDDNVCNGVA